MYAHNLLIPLFFLLFINSGVASDIVAGKIQSAICISCHGRQGKAIQFIYPNLAGQNAAYLKASLKAYKSGQRKGGQAEIMKGIAQALSETEMANLSAYYNSLEP